ncbi:response regulator [Nocardia sp. CA2R105]|uniref:response regulator transcription factor n=1 Tax=Nocardia coffeae TaxID=2873381 RepID=UPI001CA734F3|nr:response regulator [Nocardia coffeae]MBY8859341.1 response regulator [Nocardia coffeae]
MNQYPHPMSTVPNTPAPLGDETPAPLGDGKLVVARVLVAEGNPATAEMVVLVLEHAGYQSMRTVTGRQVLAAAPQWHPDLVLLDLDLPDLPGPDVCRRLHQMVSAPILAVSTESDPEAAELAMACGASDYVRKPFRTVDLLSRIESRLAGSVLGG